MKKRFGRQVQAESARLSNQTNDDEKKLEDPTNTPSDENSKSWKIDNEMYLNLGSHQPYGIEEVNAVGLSILDNLKHSSSPWTFSFDAFDCLEDLEQFLTKPTDGIQSVMFQKQDTHWVSLVITKLGEEKLIVFFKDPRGFGMPPDLGTALQNCLSTINPGKTLDIVVSPSQGHRNVSLGRSFKGEQEDEVSSGPMSLQNLKIILQSIQTQFSKRGDDLQNLVDKFKMGQLEFCTQEQVSLIKSQFQTTYKSENEKTFQNLFKHLTGDDGGPDEKEKQNNKNFKKDLSQFIKMCLEYKSGTTENLTEYRKILEKSAANFNMDCEPKTIDENMVKELEEAKRKFYQSDFVQKSFEDAGKQLGTSDTKNITSIDIKKKWPKRMALFTKTCAMLSRAEPNENLEKALKFLSTSLELDVEDLKQFFEFQKNDSNIFADYTTNPSPSIQSNINHLINGLPTPKGNSNRIQPSGIKSMEQILAEIQLDDQQLKSLVPPTPHKVQILSHDVDTEEKIHFRSLYSNKPKVVELECSFLNVKEFSKIWETRIAGEVYDWAMASKSNLNIEEAIAVMDRANELISGGHRLRVPQIISLLTFLQSESESEGEGESGRLCQIQAGEGKTSIVAMLAAIKILQQHELKCVDIITSNAVLAEEGVKSTTKFFNLLGLTVSTNNVESNSEGGGGEPRQCYKSNVVYGSIGSFQFDHLRDVRNGREFGYLILDEVDSMLIDSGAHIAKLSSPLPGMEALKYYYIKIWQGLERAEEEVAVDVKKKLEKKSAELNSKRIKMLEEAGGGKEEEDQRELEIEGMRRIRKIMAMAQIYAFHVKRFKDEDTRVTHALLREGLVKLQGKLNLIPSMGVKTVEKERREGMKFLKFWLVKLEGDSQIVYDLEEGEEEEEKKEEQEVKETAHLTRCEIERKLVEEFENFQQNLLLSTTEELEKKILDKNLLEDNPMVLDYLKEFADHSLSRWIKNAIHARYSCHEDHQYVVRTLEGKDCENEKFITPIDYANTGVTMKNTIWSYGLHQFVQLKHNLQLTPESLTSQCISNYGYIRLYPKIYGMTGTLGSQSEQELLGRMYNVQFARIPPYKVRRFIQNPGRVISDEFWSGQIVRETLNQIKNGRAVLIISQTVGDSLLIEKQLKEIQQIGIETPSTWPEYADTMTKLNLHKFHNEEQSGILRQLVAPGDVIAATNIAGRGADFKTTDQLESNGGLHVLLTFYPDNERVKDQAFFRTSRQGHAGTATIIMRESEVEQLGIPIENLFKNQDIIMDQVKQVRGRIERERIDYLKKYKIYQLYEQDFLHSLFTNLCSSKSDTLNPYVMKDLKEFWAFWLEKKEWMNKEEDEKEEMSTENLEWEKQVKKKGLEDFEKFLNDPKTQGNIMENQIMHNPYYCIQQTEFYLMNRRIIEAESSAKRAIELTSSNQSILYSAYVKLFEVAMEKGGVLMEKFKNALAKVAIFGYFHNVKNEGYKEEAILYLEKAEAALQVEVKFIQNLFTQAEKQEEKDSSPPPLTLLQNLEPQNDTPHNLNSTTPGNLSTTSASAGQLVNQDNHGRKGNENVTKIANENGHGSTFEEIVPADGDFVQPPVSTEETVPVKENIFLNHIKSRLTCLNVYSQNLIGLKSQLNSSLSSSIGLTVGSRVGEYFKQLEPKTEDESTLKKSVLQPELTELSFIGLETMYGLNEVHDAPSEIIASAQIQIGAGLASYAVGLFFPPSLPFIGPFAGTLIAEGLLDIAMELINYKRETGFDVKSYVVSKVISYGISIVTMGLGAIVSAFKVLEKAAKACRSLSNILRASKHMKRLCSLLAKGLEKLAVYFEKLVEIAQNAEKAWTFSTILRNSGKTVTLGVTGSVIMEKVVTSGLHSILEGLKPKLEEKVKLKLSTSPYMTMDGVMDKLKRMRRQETHRLVNEVLNESGLVQTIGYVSKEIALGVARHCGNWKVSLLSLTLDAFISSSSFSVDDTVEDFCSKFTMLLNKHHVIADDEVENKNENQVTMLLDEIGGMVASKIYNSIVQMAGKFTHTLVLAPVLNKVFDKIFPKPLSNEKRLTTTTGNDENSDGHGIPGQTRAEAEKMARRILNLSPDGPLTDSQINKAYYKLALTTHPDRMSTGDDSDSRAFKACVAARQYLQSGQNVSNVAIFFKECNWGTSTASGQTPSTSSNTTGNTSSSNNGNSSNQGRPSSGYDGPMDVTRTTIPGQLSNTSSSNQRPTIMPPVRQPMQILTTSQNWGGQRQIQIRNVFDSFFAVNAPWLFNNCATINASERFLGVDEYRLSLHTGVVNLGQGATESDLHLIIQRTGFEPTTTTMNSSDINDQSISRLLNGMNTNRAILLLPPSPVLSNVDGAMGHAVVIAPSNTGSGELIVFDSTRPSFTSFGELSLRHFMEEYRDQRGGGIVKIITAGNLDQARLQELQRIVNSTLTKPTHLTYSNNNQNSGAVVYGAIVDPANPFRDREETDEGLWYSPPVQTELWWGNQMVVMNTEIDFVLPVNTGMGTTPEANSVVFQCATALRDARFGREQFWYLAGHVGNQRLGGLGNDANMMVMSGSLNRVYYNYLESQMIHVRNLIRARNVNSVALQHLTLTVVAFNEIVDDRHNLYQVPWEFQANIQLVNGDDVETAIFHEWFGHLQLRRRYPNMRTGWFTNDRPADRWDNAVAPSSELGDDDVIMDLF